jgi:hypothetical protein
MLYAVQIRDVLRVRALRFTKWRVQIPLCAWENMHLDFSRVRSVVAIAVFQGKTQISMTEARRWIRFLAKSRKL